MAPNRSSRGQANPPAQARAASRATRRRVHGSLAGVAAGATPRHAAAPVPVPAPGPAPAPVPAPVPAHALVPASAFTPAHHAVMQQNASSQAAVKQEEDAQPAAPHQETAQHVVAQHTSSQSAVQQNGSAQAAEEQPQGGQAAPPVPVFHCPNCPKLFTKHSTMQTHIADRHVGMRCYFPGCGVTTNTELGMIEHFLQHQRLAIEGGGEPTVCPWPGCGKNFSRKDTVQRCIKRHNNEERQNH
ncbi:hypothetical protein F5Y14DRAFT_447375 [Nemania sp. NC0429]|nr:hypothetical protein F5Y14DRAFT_447375 [Nemania sp. NC0429]